MYYVQLVGNHQAIMMRQQIFNKGRRQEGTIRGRKRFRKVAADRISLRWSEYGFLLTKFSQQFCYQPRLSS